jgi:hypothetical protein
MLFWNDRHALKACSRRDCSKLEISATCVLSDLSSETIFALREYLLYLSSLTLLRQSSSSFYSLLQLSAIYYIIQVPFPGSFHCPRRHVGRLPRV